MSSSDHSSPAGIRVGRSVSRHRTPRGPVRRIDRRVAGRRRSTGRVVAVAIAVLAPGLVAAGAAGAPAVAAPVAGLDAATAPVPAPAATASPAERGPVLAFDRVEHDYGPLWEGESRTTTFAFRNAGDEPLVIRAVRASCGCTTTELEQTVFSPGDGDAITVHFDAQGRGRQAKTVTVVSNAGSPVRLTIRSQVRQFLAPEPTTLRLGDLRRDETRTARVRFTSADPRFSPQGVTVRGAGSRWVDARIVPRAAGPRPAGPQLPGAAPPSAGAAGEADGDLPPGAFDVEVTVRPGARWGSLFASLRVWGLGTRPGDEEGRARHERDLTITGRVFGEIIASDTMIRVSRVPAGRPFRRVVELESRSGESLPLRTAVLVRPSLDSMTVDLAPEPGSDGRRWRLVVEADPGDATGRVSGQVVLTTDVPGEERLTFAVAGMIAAPEG